MGEISKRRVLLYRTREGLIHPKGKDLKMIIDDITGCVFLPAGKDKFDRTVYSTLPIDYFLERS